MLTLRISPLYKDIKNILLPLPDVEYCVSSWEIFEDDSPYRLKLILNGLDLSKWQYAEVAAVSEVSIAAAAFRILEADASKSTLALIEARPNTGAFQLSTGQASYELLPQTTLARRRTSIEGILLDTLPGPSLPSSGS